MQDSTKARLKRLSDTPQECVDAQLYFIAGATEDRLCHNICVTCQANNPGPTQATKALVVDAAPAKLLANFLAAPGLSHTHRSDTAIRNVTSFAHAAIRAKGAFRPGAHGAHFVKTQWNILVAMQMLDAVTSTVINTAAMHQVDVKMLRTACDGLGRADVIAADRAQKGMQPNA